MQQSPTLKVISVWLLIIPSPPPTHWYLLSMSEPVVQRIDYNNKVHLSYINTAAMLWWLRLLPETKRLDGECVSGPAGKNPNELHLNYQCVFSVDTRGDVGANSKRGSLPSSQPHLTEPASEGPRGSRTRTLGSHHTGRTKSVAIRLLTWCMTWPGGSCFRWLQLSLVGNNSLNVVCVSAAGTIIRRRPGRTSTLMSCVIQSHPDAKASG